MKDSTNHVGITTEKLQRSPFSVANPISTSPRKLIDIPRKQSLMRRSSKQYQRGFRNVLTLQVLSVYLLWIQAILPVSANDSLSRNTRSQTCLDRKAPCSNSTLPCCSGYCHPTLATCKNKPPTLPPTGSPTSTCVYRPRRKCSSTGTFFAGLYPCCAGMYCAEHPDYKSHRCFVPDPPQGQCFQDGTMCSGNYQCCTGGCERITGLCDWRAPGGDPNLAPPTTTGTTTNSITPGESTTLTTTNSMTETTTLTTTGSTTPTSTSPTTTLSTTATRTVTTTPTTSLTTSQSSTSTSTATSTLTATGSTSLTTTPTTTDTATHTTTLTTSISSTTITTLTSSLTTTLTATPTTSLTTSSTTTPTTSVTSTPTTTSTSTLTTTQTSTRTTSRTTTVTTSQTTSLTTSITSTQTTTPTSTFTTTPTSTVTTTPTSTITTTRTTSLTTTLSTTPTTSQTSTLTTTSTTTLTSSLTTSPTTTVTSSLTTSLTTTVTTTLTTTPETTPTTTQTSTLTTTSTTSGTSTQTTTGSTTVTTSVVSTTLTTTPTSTETSTRTSTLTTTATKTATTTPTTSGSTTDTTTVTTTPILFLCSSNGQFLQEPSDFLFILDHSGSTYRQWFQAQVDFLQMFVDTALETNVDFHVGVMRYSGSGEVVYPIGNLNRPFSSLSHNGNTYSASIDKALKKAHNEMLAGPGYRRQNTVAILFNDNIYRSESVPGILDDRLSKLYDAGVTDLVTIFLDGDIADQASITQMAAITSRPDLAFVARSTNDLNISVLQQIITRTSCHQTLSPSLSPTVSPMPSTTLTTTPTSTRTTTPSTTPTTTPTTTTTLTTTASSTATRTETTTLTTTPSTTITSTITTSATTSSTTTPSTTQISSRTTTQTTTETTTAPPTSSPTCSPITPAPTVAPSFYGAFPLNCTSRPRDKCDIIPCCEGLQCTDVNGALRCAVNDPPPCTCYEIGHLCSTKSQCCTNRCLKPEGVCAPVPTTTLTTTYTLTGTSTPTSTESTTITSTESTTITSTSTLTTTRSTTVSTTYTTTESTTVTTTQSSSVTTTTRMCVLADVTHRSCNCNPLTSIVHVFRTTNGSCTCRCIRRPTTTTTTTPTSTFTSTFTTTISTSVTTTATSTTSTSFTTTPTSTPTTSTSTTVTSTPRTTGTTTQTTTRTTSSTTSATTSITTSQTSTATSTSTWTVTTTPTTTSTTQTSTQTTTLTSTRSTTPTSTSPTTTLTTTESSTPTTSLSTTATTTLTTSKTTTSTSSLTTTLTTTLATTQTSTLSTTLTTTFAPPTSAPTSAPIVCEDTVPLCDNFELADCSSIQFLHVPCPVLCEICTPPNQFNHVVEFGEFQPCPELCGTLSRGGGKCGKNISTGQIVCTSCDYDRTLVNGNCILSEACYANRILFGDGSSQYCSCEDSNCIYCSDSRGLEKCQQCEAGYFLSQGTCRHLCPYSTVPVGTSELGQSCLASLTCQHGRVHGDSLDSCSCQPECVQCEFADQVSFCTRCASDMYLYNGGCVHSCKNQENQNLISLFDRKHGYQCREPFSCQFGMDKTGKSCTCPDSVGGRNCQHCWIGITSLCYRNNL